MKPKPGASSSSLRTSMLLYVLRGGRLHRRRPDIGCLHDARALVDHALLARRRIDFDLFGGHVLFDDEEFDATVLFAPLLGIVGSDRLLRAPSSSRESRGVDALLFHEKGHHGFGSVV